MKHPRLVAIGTAVAALALPSTAAAHQQPSTETVAGHVRSADEALAMVAGLVSQNDHAAAAIEAVRNRRQTRAAAREAASVRGRARRAAALELVARLQNENVETYVDIVDQVSGDLQVDVARTIRSGLQGREEALRVLRNLVGKLPAEAQEGIARAIAALSTDLRDEYAEVIDMLEVGSLPVQVDSILSEVLGIATSAIDTALDRLESIVDVVPAVAQPYVQQALDRVRQQLASVQTMLGDLFGDGGPVPSGLPIPSFVQGLLGGSPTDGSTTGGLPIPSGLPIPPFVLEMLNGFGSGDSTDGDSDPTGPVPPIVGGFIPDLDGFIPGGLPIPSFIKNLLGIS